MYEINISHLDRFNYFQCQKLLLIQSYIVYLKRKASWGNMGYFKEPGLFNTFLRSMTMALCEKPQVFYTCSILHSLFISKDEWITQTA